MAQSATATTWAQRDLVISTLYSTKPPLPAPLLSPPTPKTIQITQTPPPPTQKKRFICKTDNAPIPAPESPICRSATPKKQSLSLLHHLCFHFTNAEAPTHPITVHTRKPSKQTYPTKPTTPQGRAIHGNNIPWRMVCCSADR